MLKTVFFSEKLLALKKRRETTKGSTRDTNQQPDKSKPAIFLRSRTSSKYSQDVL